MTESVIPSVLYEVRGAVALVTLNRPQALNSFTREMHSALWTALDQAEANPAVRAVVLTGAGRGFCAGLDLSELDFTPGPGLLERADPGPVINDAFNPTTRRLQSLRMPVICAVNGVAAAGTAAPPPGGHGPGRSGRVRAAGAVWARGGGAGRGVAAIGRWRGRRRRRCFRRCAARLRRSRHARAVRRRRSTRLETDLARIIGSRGATGKPRRGMPGFLLSLMPSRDLSSSISRGAAL